MTITIYVNFTRQEVVTEEQFQAMRTQEVNSRCFDTENFQHWLNDNFMPFDIWEMSEEDKDIVWNDFVEACESEWECDYGNDWGEYKIEI